MTRPVRRTVWIVQMLAMLASHVAGLSNTTPVRGVGGKYKVAVAGTDNRKSASATSHYVYRLSRDDCVTSESSYQRQYKVLSAFVPPCSVPALLRSGVRGAIPNLAICRRELNIYFIAYPG